MLSRRIAAAATATLVGVLVLFLLSRLLHGMLDDPGMYVGCASGAFLTTLLMYAPGRMISRRGLGASVVIVLGTYVVMALAFLIDKQVRGVFDSTTWDEARNVLFWAVITTSWWLVPGVMLTLWAFDRRLSPSRSL